MSTQLAFPSVQDYRARLRTMQEAICQAGLDALALCGPDNHRFLGGVDGIASVRPVWLIVPSSGDPVFVSPRIESAEISAQSWIPVALDWVEWVEDGVPIDPIDALVQVLRPYGETARIGVDYDQTSAAALERLRNALGAHRIVDATAVVREVRKVKDRTVIDVVRRSADVAVHQFQASLAAAVPGAREWEVVRASRDAGIERAAYWWEGNEEYSPLLPGIHCLASGPERTARAHARGAGRVLVDGDLMQVCYCGRPFFGHGICMDRPVHIGTVPLDGQVRAVVDAARVAQQAALDMVRPGTTTGAVHQAAVDAIADLGMAATQRHRTGRGIGLSDPEWPEIKAGDPTVLEAGMLIAIEPGVYVDGVGGARFGDTVLVTDDGFEEITPLDMGRTVS